MKVVRLLFKPLVNIVDINTVIPQIIAPIIPPKIIPAPAILVIKLTIGKFLASEY